MGNRSRIYMKAENYVEVKCPEDEFDFLYYQFRGEEGLYEMRFWANGADLFELEPPDEPVIYASLAIEEYELNPFPSYENGKLWEWMKKVLEIHATGIVPVPKRFRYI